LSAAICQFAYQVLQGLEGITVYYGALSCAYAQKQGENVSKRAVSNDLKREKLRPCAYFMRCI